MEDYRYSCENFSYNHSCFKNFDFLEIEPQTHDVYELIFVKQGSLSYMIEEKIYTVNDNDIIFTKPGILHRIIFSDNSIYDRYAILFDEKIIFNKIFDKIPKDIDVFYIKKSKKIEHIFQKMDFYCANFKELELENILTHLIDEIFYNILLSKEPNHKKLYTSHPIVTKAVHFIEDNICNNLSIEIICDYLFITKSHLNKLFNRYLGISPGKYITTKRLVAAQKEIRNGEMPTQVFSKFGFLEYSTFYRNYKEYFGYSPSEENDRVIIRQIDGY